MKHTSLIVGLALASLCVGCDSNPKCEELADHITTVLSGEREAASDGKKVPQEAKDKAKKDLVASCNAEAPPDDVFDCALKATTRAALTECDALAESADE